MEITEFTRTVAIAAISAQIRDAEEVIEVSVAPHITPTLQDYVKTLNTALDELYDIKRKEATA